MANFTDTQKQGRIEQAFAEHPRKPKETKRHWFQRIAPTCGASVSYLYALALRKDYQAIGDEIRRRDQEKMLPAVTHFDTWNLGPVKDFKGWGFEFGRFKIIVESYLTFARHRGDVWAEAFLQNIRDEIENGQKRSTREGRL